MIAKLGEVDRARSKEGGEHDGRSFPLRVASIAQQSGIRLDDKGGGAIHVRAIIEFLQQAGHKVSFMTFGESILEVMITDDLAAMQPLRLGVTGNRLFQLLERAVRRVHKALHLPYLALFDNWRFYDALVHALSGYDVIHERFSMIAVAGALAAKRLGIPLVLEVNADFLEETDSFTGGLKGMQRTAVRWASAFCFQRSIVIIAVSNQLKAHLARTWQIPAEKIIVLPNGADVNKFHPDVSQKEARLRLGLNDAPTAVFVGGFYPWHAPLHLIEAFAQTSQSIPEAQLCLVGNGPMRAQTEARARELGLDGVIFAGAVSHEQIPDWLTAADIALAPYAPLERELWFSPLKLFEYMAAGKAIVASDMGQVAEVIQDGHNGILIPVGDVAGFAAAMAELLTDKGKRDQLGQHARQQAISRHSWQYYAEQLAAIYVQARQALA